ncbi:hypothetical protein FACS18949_14480 [Clostridia bacterium]|nr:hypothetical protein FACS18949_14480 [Clostridia bacterium]
MKLKELEKRVAALEEEFEELRKENDSTEVTSVDDLRFVMSCNAQFGYAGSRIVRCCLENLVAEELGLPLPHPDWRQV